MSDPEYKVQFNLYYASEGGFKTGHANVTVIKKDESGKETKYTFGANSTGGNVGTWVNPYSTESDGRVGEDSPWTPDNPEIPDGGVVSSDVPISEEDYQKILDFVKPYTGDDYKGNSSANYDVFASINPMSPDDSWSCYSFVQQIYEIIDGSGSTFVDEFTDGQLDQLKFNYIELFYGDMDAGRNMDNFVEYTKRLGSLAGNLPDDYGWGWDNPGAVLRELLPPWAQKALLPLNNAPGWRLSAQLRGGDPLVLDLDGNGKIDLISVDGGARFDFWGDGFREKVGWVGPGDALLALDGNGNGTIDGVHELFGSPHPLSYVMDGGANWHTEHGFAKLAVHDDNGDGEIDARDAIWADLKVWRDANSNGLTDPGELIGVDAAGIRSIGITNYKLDSYIGGGVFQRVVEGNIISHNGAFTMKNGEAREIVNAWLTMDLQNTVHAKDYTLDVRTLFLPTLRGYGQIADLHVAASMDNGPGGLLEKLAAFTVGRNTPGALSDLAAIRGEVEDILFAWAGIDVAAVREKPLYGEHGQLGAMPEFLFIRKFMGQETAYLGAWLDLSDSMPRLSDGMKAVTKVWENLLDAFTARLVFQLGGKGLFPGVSYSPISDVFEGDLVLSQAGVNAMKAAASGAADIAGTWHDLASLIDQVRGLASLSPVETAMLNTAVTQSTAGALNWAGVLATLGEITFRGGSGGVTIEGSRWDDIIYGGTGNDTLIGGDGNDFLDAGSGNTNDVFIGGRGNDTYSSGFGNDIYQYDYGHDVIRHNGYTNNFNIIRFGAGISAGDVSLHIAKIGPPASHVIFDVKGRGSISVDDARGNSYAVGIIDELHFTDGTVVAVKDMLVTFHGNGEDNNFNTANWGSTGSVAVYGYGGDDSISIRAPAGKTAFVDGGAGDDIIYGWLSDDTFFFSGGHDRVYGGGGFDTILLPESYTAEDVSLYRYGDADNIYANKNHGRDLLITVEGLGSLTVREMFLGQSDDLVHKLQFADGSSIDLLAQDYVTIGTDGNDTFQSTYGGIWANRKDDIRGRRAAMHPPPIRSMPTGETITSSPA